VIAVPAPDYLLVHPLHCRTEPSRRAGFSVNVQEHEKDVGVWNRISLTKTGQAPRCSCRFRKFPSSREGGGFRVPSSPMGVILAKAVCPPLPLGLNSILDPRANLQRSPVGRASIFLKESGAQTPYLTFDLITANKHRPRRCGLNTMAGLTTTNGLRQPPSHRLAKSDTPSPVRRAGLVESSKEPVGRSKLHYCIIYNYDHHLRPNRRLGNWTIHR
jgi:hypothetical protein